MTWLIPAWSLIAGAALILALMHVLIWARGQQTGANLLFGIAALSIAAFAVFEQLLMHAETPEAFGTWQRWAHVPGAVAHISLVGFVYVLFGTGRAWLAATSIGLRLLSVFMNFVLSPNVNYTEITELEYQQLLGEPVAVAVGVPSPWTYLGPLSLLIFVVFVSDAALNLWRRGDPALRRRAVLVGGGITAFGLFVLVHVGLLHSGIVRTPYVISPLFLLLVLVMSYDLVNDVLRVSKLDADLRESKARLDQASDAASLGMWTWDIPRDSIWATGKAHALLNLEPGKAHGLAEFLQTVHPADREAVRSALDDALQGTCDYDAQYRVPLDEGGTRWIAARGSVVLDNHARPVSMRGVALDITARKTTELESQQRRAELNHLSRVSVVGELSASLVHELNQPLTAIMSNAQTAQRLLVRKPVDRALLAEILDDIVDSDRRATEIIHRLRPFLRKEPNSYCPVDINDAIRKVVGITHNDLVNDSVRLTTELHAGQVSVMGDTVQFQQVILNLIMNARDSMAGMAGADRRITIRTRLTEENQIEVSVSDTGPGIRPGDFPYLFDPFFTTKPQGMGMGLTVCRSIIVAHGGEFEASGTEAAGARFQFTLPVLEGQQP